MKILRNIFDPDRFREILDTLSRNKSRTFLTGFGVFWGVFMLVALMGGGKGLKDLLQTNFDGFATNSAFVMAQPTTKAYAGFKKGRQWSMEYKDVERMKSQVAELDVVTPVVMRGSVSAVFKERKSSCSVKGLLADYQEVETPQMFYGRYLSSERCACWGKGCTKTCFPEVRIHADRWYV